MHKQDPWTYRTRRGKKKMDDDFEQVEKIIEISHPNESSPMVYRASTSLLPARPLGAPLAEPDIISTIKKEVKEEVNTPESNSYIPSNTGENFCNPEVLSNIQELIEECRNPTANETHESSAEDKTPVAPLLQPASRTIKEEPVDAGDIPPSSPGYLIPQCSDLLGINREHSVSFRDAGVSLSRSSSTETVLADENQQEPSAVNPSGISSESFTPKVHIRTETLENHETLTSKSSNKRSTGDTASDVTKKMKTEPHTLIATESGALVMGNSTEICEPSSNNHSLKCVSVSSSNEIHMAPKTANAVEGGSFDLITVETSENSNTPGLTNIAEVGQTFSFKRNHPLQVRSTLSGGMPNQSSLVPTSTTPINVIPVANSEAPTAQISTCKKPFKTALLKYVHLNTKINRTDVEECLNILNHTYPQTGSRSLFFSNIPSLKQTGVEPMQPSAINSSVSTAEPVISTNDLRKIIEFSSSLQRHRFSPLQLPLQNGTRGGNTVLGTDKSVITNITSMPHQLMAAKNQSDESFTPKIHIKEEPLDSYEVPSLVHSSSSCHDASTSNKRAAGETDTVEHKITKKIKTEPISPGYSSAENSVATENELQAGPDEHGSASRSLNYTTINIHTNSDAVKHCTSKDLNLLLPPKNVSSDEKKTINNGLDSKLSQSLVVENQSVTFNHICLKTEPLDDCEALPSAMRQTPSKNSKKSAVETASDIPKSSNKQTKIVAAPSDHTVLSGEETKRTISKTILTAVNFTNVSNAASAKSVPKSSSVNDFSLASSSKASLPSQSRVVDTSKVSTYLHLLPDDNINENVQNSNRMCNTAVNYGKIPIVNSFLQRHDTHFVETKDLNNNLGLDRSSSDASIISAYDRIPKLNNSLLSTSNNETTRRKRKLTPEEYLQRKSLLPARDPRLRKSSSSSQALSPATTMSATANHRNQNVISLSPTQNAHIGYISRCLEGPVVSSNIQMRRESLENSTILRSSTMSIGSQRSQRPSFEKVLHEHSISDVLDVPTRDSGVSSNVGMGQDLQATSRTDDARALKNAPRDPRKSSSKSYYQKAFDVRRGNQSSSSTLQREKVGKKFIETNDLPCLILEWNVDWLQTQESTSMCPPVCYNYPRIKDTYASVLEYYNTYLPLHLLSIWLKIHDTWKVSNTFYDSVFENTEERQNFVKTSCSVIFSAADKSNWPKREDLLICTASRKDGSTKKLFGRVVGIVEREYFPQSSCPFYERPGVWKKLHLDILCAESFGVTPPASIKLQNLINIRISLNQNDALRYMNPSMRAVVLNPREHGSLVQSVTVKAFQGASMIKSNVDIIMRSVKSLKHGGVTIVRTSGPSDSVLAILHVFPCLVKNNSILLICVKDEDVFLNLAVRLKNYSTVLAVKDEDMPHLAPELRKSTVKNSNSEVLQTSQVVLTLMSAVFFGNLEDRLSKQNVVCMVHEAQFFAETETALLLKYKVERLVLVGRPARKADMHSILKRYGYDVSLCHRFSSL